MSTRRHRITQIEYNIQMTLTMTILIYMYQASTDYSMLAYKLPPNSCFFYHGNGASAPHTLQFSNSPRRPKFEHTSGLPHFLHFVKSTPPLSALGYVVGGCAGAPDPVMPLFLLKSFIVDLMGVR